MASSRNPGDVLGASPERDNYTRLTRLLICGGTLVLRELFDSIHPPANLSTVLTSLTVSSTLSRMRRNRFLTHPQWTTLIPSSGTCGQSKDFDITLLCKLFREICNLTAPATGWDSLPNNTDLSLTADLARIKYFRNEIYGHVNEDMDLRDDEFVRLWKEIKDALLRIVKHYAPSGLTLAMDWKNAIDNLLTAPLTYEDKNYLEELQHWYLEDIEVKKALEEMRRTAEGTSREIEETRRTAERTSRATEETRDLIQTLTITVMASQEMDNQIKKLAFSDFGPEINTKCISFHPNTRQWILDQVKSHVDSDQPDSCIMLITAGPGMGKSTLSAKICQTYKDLGCLAGCHFFQYSNSTRNNPRLMLQSIARQMCNSTIPGYREALESKLQTDLGKEISKMNCEELLTIAFEEPFCNVKQPHSNLLIVIDALDECSLDPKDELLKALRKKLSCFPSWLRFVLTSRPSTNTSALGSTFDVEIKPTDQSNIKDLVLFFDFKLKALYPQCNNDDNADLVQNLVDMTKGLFLVAFFVIDYLKQESGAGSPEKVLELFPNGISSVYENYFSRLKEVLLPYITEEKRFYDMLEAVVATNNALPKNMFYNILCLKSEREVPRPERKTRKDAVNTLHWLFPVDGDHVAPFHKSVFDWLTLQGDEEHDFSVRVEDGDEVLASQCNDVLSDIRNGKKDLDKPLNLTENENYALGFLCHLVEKHSPVVKDDRYGFFSNIYLLTAFKIHDIIFGNCISDGVISRSLLDILREMTISFPMNIPQHQPSCHLYCSTPFGSYLAFVLQAGVSKGVGEKTTPNSLDALKKHLLPYFYERSLLESPFASHSGAVLSSLRYLLKCRDGFIAVLPEPWSSSMSNVVYKFHLDGCLMTQKSFPAKRLIATSSNINFIVAAEENGKTIEVLDSTTLEVVSRYEFLHDAIVSCHVFGDDQGWFIVIGNGRHDSKVYVIEGLTGRVRNTITLKEDSTVMDVSCKGHIVVTRTWNCHEPEKINTFTNKDGEVEVMNWRISRNKEYLYGYREIILYHHDPGQEPIPIHPLVEKICHCHYIHYDINVDEAIYVSEDGSLLAYHYKDSIFIVNTSDGSLFKRWSFDTWPVSCLGISFVSRSYLVTTEQSSMSVISVNTGKIEHSIYLPFPVLPNMKHHLLLPKEDEKSFDLISNQFKPGFYEVSRLVFHNLNLHGFE